MRYGMSERLGPRVFGHDRCQPFLGREFSSEPDYSDEIAREIDDEIRRIVEEAHQTAKDILAERREELDRISKILLERETIDAEQFVALLEGASEEEVFGDDEEETAEPPEAEPPRRAPAARAAAACRSRARVRGGPAEPGCAAAGWTRAGGDAPGGAGDGDRQRDARLVLGWGRVPRPDRAIAHGRELLDEGGHPRRRWRVHPAGRRGGGRRRNWRGGPVVEVIVRLGGAEGAVSIDTSKARSPRRRSTPARRSSTTSLRCGPSPSWRRCAPTAVARSC